ncbi:MAG TPA: hypothetical protein VH277_19385 [Gemmatimonadaceae bacterium]|nr:hypothetical protein [Gemmatimonadaceae bacterium]
MFHRWAAPMLVLALCAMSPKYAAGQSTSPSRGHAAKGKVGTNSPNPFNPDTKINFSVGDESCAPGTEQHVVTMRILNILSQPVAFPQLYAGSGSTTVAPAVAGHAIASMTLSCGSYVAYWNGKVAATGKEAASGTYGVQLFIDKALQPGTVRIFRSK